MSIRHHRQRVARARLKADVHYLLGKLLRGDDSLDLHDEIAEMRVRLKPPTGARAPIILTDYSRGKR